MWKQEPMWKLQRRGIEGSWECAWGLEYRGTIVSLEENWSILALVTYSCWYGSQGGEENTFFRLDK
jgi:hypothetical protein